MMGAVDAVVDAPVAVEGKEVEGEVVVLEEEEPTAAVAVAVVVVVAVEEST